MRSGLSHRAIRRALINEARAEYGGRGRKDKLSKEEKPVAVRGKSVHGGKRSHHERCPKCKKIRLKRARADAWFDGFVTWVRLSDGGPKVCHICQKRAKDNE